LNALIFVGKLEDDASFPETPGASTPSSIASPRSPNTVQLEKLTLTAKLLGLHHERDDATGTGTTEPALDELIAQSHTVQCGAVGMQGALRLVREHLCSLHQHLTVVRQEVGRRQQLHETRLLEKECEVRLARSEAASYKLAAQARVTAVNTMKM
jgi:hypothetical protein